MRTSILIFSIFIFGACASLKKQPEAPNKALIGKVNTLEEQVRDLKDQNSVLKHALKSEKKNVAQPLADLDKAPPPIPEMSAEHSLYNAALEAYWAKDSAKLKRSASMLLKGYPNSAYADNVLYLRGALLMNEGQYGESLQVLNQLIKEYPLSSKVVSADFLKAMIYTKLNLAEQANDLFRMIAKKYKGSTEAKQATAQLKAFSPKRKEVSKR